MHEWFDVSIAKEVLRERGEKKKKNGENKSTIKTSVNAHCRCFTKVVGYTLGTVAKAGLAVPPIWKKGELILPHAYVPLNVVKGKGKRVINYIFQPFPYVPNIWNVPIHGVVNDFCHSSVLR